MSVCVEGERLSFAAYLKASLRTDEVILIVDVLGLLGACFAAREFIAWVIDT
jgi:hypothetical protein